MKCEFLLGTTASQTAREKLIVYLAIESRDRPESRVNDDELKMTAESDPSLSAYELSWKFGKIIPLICKLLTSFAFLSTNVIFDDLIFWNYADVKFEYITCNFIFSSCKMNCNGSTLKNALLKFCSAK